MSLTIQGLLTGGRQTALGSRAVRHAQSLEARVFVACDVGATRACFVARDAGS
jgi:hypothetical protein